MPFDDFQDQETDAMPPLLRQRPIYADEQALPGDYNQQSPPTDAQFQRRLGAPAQAATQPSIGQRILALGERGSLSDTDANGMPNVPQSIGSRIVAMGRQPIDSSAPRLTRMPDASAPRHTFDQAPMKAEVFSNFVPVRADKAIDLPFGPSPSRFASPDVDQRSRRTIGNNQAPTAAGAGSGSVPLNGSQRRQTFDGKGGVVKVDDLARQHSKIAPNSRDEPPNLKLGASQTLQKALGGLMRSIRKTPPPQRGFPIVQSRGRTVTLIYPDGRRETRKGNHPQRDNNPGNMEAGSFSKRQGQIGRDGSFAVFPSSEAGWAAMDARLKSDLYSNLSVDDAVATWAPWKNAKGQVINDTPGYQKKVRDALGVAGDTKISSLTPQQFETLKQTIARVEGFYEARPKYKVKVGTQPATPQARKPKKN